MFDIIIKNGQIVDGSGSPSYKADVGIVGNMIIAIGKLNGKIAEKTIDADGLIVAPGFIDMHTHDDLTVLEQPTVEAKCKQGVTTSVVGNCGFSLFPMLPETKNLYCEYTTGLFGLTDNNLLGYAQLKQYYEKIEKTGSTINIASLIGHGTLRVAVMGYEKRKPTVKELKRMKELLLEAMQGGAIGMSLGLVYAPGCYAGMDELIELSKVVGKEGGIITVHLRNASNYFRESIDEMLELSAQANVPIHLSHFKVLGNQFSGQGAKSIEYINRRRMEGIDVTVDSYPYSAGSTNATILLPPWCLEGGVEMAMKRIENIADREKIKQDIIHGIDGSQWCPIWKLIGWENIMISSLGLNENKKYEGRCVTEIAKEIGCHPADVILDLLHTEKGQVMMITFQSDHEDLEAIMRHDLQMIISDGIPSKVGKVHPRLYGTFARVLGTYVREKNILTLEKAISKMTYIPANRIGILDRGLIRPGMFADITVFDKNIIADRATYLDPTISPIGIDTVMVNGKVIVEKSLMTGQYPGKTLKRSMNRCNY